MPDIGAMVGGLSRDQQDAAWRSTNPARAVEPPAAVAAGLPLNPVSISRTVAGGESATHDTGPLVGGWYSITGKVTGTGGPTGKVIGTCGFDGEATLQWADDGSGTTDQATCLCAQGRVAPDGQIALGVEANGSVLTATVEITVMRVGQ